MSNLIALFAAALLFGGMVFFAAVMAPLVFTRLPGAQAGAFIRAVFPFYYLYVLVTAAAAALALAPRWEAAGMAAVAALTVWLRQWLMPRLNDASDAAKGGDDRARAWFDRSHRVSVALNFVQLAVVGVVLARFLG